MAKNGIQMIHTRICAHSLLAKIITIQSFLCPACTNMTRTDGYQGFELLSGLLKLVKSHRILAHLTDWI